MNYESGPLHGETFSEHPLRPSLGAHDVLVAYCKDETREGIADTFKDLYKVLAAQDRELVAALFSHENSGVISRDDMNFLIVLFGVARLQGPSLRLVQEAVMTTPYRYVDFQHEIVESHLDPLVVEFLVAILKKLLPYY